MTPAQLEALGRMRGASLSLQREIGHLMDWGRVMQAERLARVTNRVLAQARIITEAAADLTTETVRAQLSASLATGEK